MFPVLVALETSSDLGAKPHPGEGTCLAQLTLSEPTLHPWEPQLHKSTAS